MKQQRKEIRQMEAHTEETSARDFRERVLAADAEAQKNVAPFLENPVLRRIVKSFTNDERGDFAKWACNPRVIEMLRRAQKAMDEGKLTEADAERIMIESLAAKGARAFRRQRLDHDAFSVRLGQFALVHGLLRATQHLDHPRVARPLGEIAALVVRERLDDAPQHRVFQEGRHVFLRLGIRREHTLAEVPRGSFLGVRLHLADLLALLLHERLPVLRALAELTERRALVFRRFGSKGGGRRERRSRGDLATPRRVASDYVSGAPNRETPERERGVELTNPAASSTPPPG